MKLFTLFLLTISGAAQAADCDYLKDKYASSLDATRVARDYVQGMLEKIGIDAKNPLVHAEIPITIVDAHNDANSGFTRFRFGEIRAMYVDGRVLRVCTAFRDGTCDANAEGRFSWNLKRADRTNPYGEVVGYECTLQSFPTPFPNFLNSDTRNHLFGGGPSGLWVTEQH